MASSKKLGFFWGEEKLTVVEFDKNTTLQVISSPLGLKNNIQSPFSSNLTEEIQITAILQKVLQDNRITDNSFYVALPMKEIILRSFIIPFVKSDNIQNAIKFEAKKYLPFDIQDLAFVFHATPFMEDQTRRLQVIFFAVRKEVLNRYQRIFMNVNAEIVYSEPYMVSLAKALLFRKEIKPTDHIAFLILDNNLGRICFIDQGIPQFIREFPIGSSSLLGENDESTEDLNLRIVNEVGNSFDFYARQFSGERIEQMFVSCEFVQKDLLSALETELKVTIKKISPVLTTRGGVQINDMEAIYAMGVCVTPPMDSLSAFNFLGDKTPKSNISNILALFLKVYKEILYVFLVCAAVLAGAFVFFRVQLHTDQAQYDQLSQKQGVFFNESLENIQAEFQQNTDLLNKYKNIKTKSDVAVILLRIASHLPQGALLSALEIKYDEADADNARVTIDMKGDVLKEGLNEQIEVVNKIFSDFKNDKELSRFIKKVNLASLNIESFKGRQVVGFNIHCS